jgi:hypothetical protein
MVVEVLFNAGDHVPVIPFKSVVGRGLRVAPEQIGPTAVKDGVAIGFTTTVIVVGVIHPGNNPVNV